MGGPNEESILQFLVAMGVDFFHTLSEWLPRFWF